VFAAHADPIGLGHVAALARPGGNITGTSMLLTELAAKGLEMMAEALPHSQRGIHACSGLDVAARSRGQQVMKDLCVQAA
jgi:ABC-type uncharacterized transport system substrate-binding protein